MKDGFIKVGAACTDITIADTLKNSTRIIEAVQRAGKRGVKLLCFPELCVTGYTCGDLFSQTKLLDSAEDALFNIATATQAENVLFAIGLPLRNNGKLYNCAAVLFKGNLLAVIPKQHIPNHNEFYEGRNFSAYVGSEGNSDTITLRNKDYTFGSDIVLRCPQMPELGIGIEICEDLWVVSPPSDRLAVMGATVILNLSAGNELIGKAQYRRRLVASQSAHLLAGYVYSSAGRGESTTDIVFSGHKLIYENGEKLGEGLPFDYDNNLTVSEIDIGKLAHERRCTTTFVPNMNGRTVLFDFGSIEETELTRKIAKLPFLPDSDTDDRYEQILTIQAYGLIKRMEHTGSRSLVLGISGGLDSCLALIVCVRASDILKRPRDTIQAVTMPCFGTTSRTHDNAKKLCDLLGVSFTEIDIKASVTTHLRELGHSTDVHDTVYENAQARMRTMVLMDMANDVGGLVVGTGDMSELALGWATYNGDHMSSYGVNASVPKTLVRYIVDAYARSVATVQPELSAVLGSILDTPVSPELLPSDKNGDITQITEDIVGPYELHDFFLYYTLRYGYAPDKLFRLAKYAFAGDFPATTITKWQRTFYRRFFSQQFKRSCLPDGVKTGSVSLSPRGDWRMPSDANSAIWLADIDVNDEQILRIKRK